jgi:hypothetical protein
VPEGGRAPAYSHRVIPLKDEAGTEYETVVQRDNEPFSVKTMQCLAVGFAEEEGEPLQVGAEATGVVGGMADEGGEAVGEDLLLAAGQPAGQEGASRRVRPHRLRRG